MQFCISVVLVFVGLAIVRGTSHRRTRLSPEVSNLLISRNEQLWSLIDQLRTDKVALTTRLQVMEQNRELDRGIAMDAMNREERAKNAVRAVLKDRGCSEEVIQGVIDLIDDAAVKHS